MNINNRIFQVQINNRPIKKHIQIKANTAMNSLWSEFNGYAKKRGFTESTTNWDCLGALAWNNGKGDQMTIIEID